MSDHHKAREQFLPKTKEAFQCKLESQGESAPAWSDFRVFSFCLIFLSFFYVLGYLKIKERKSSH